LVTARTDRRARDARSATHTVAICTASTNDAAHDAVSAADKA
jgi:hypothetical protein